MWGPPINNSRFFPQVICRASGFLSCKFPGSRAFHETAAMPKRRHSNEKDELLMAEVKKYPFLYDKNHGSYNNQNKRKAVWEEIAAVVGISGTDSKLRWSNIRDCFMRCLKQKAQKERATGTQTHRFHYKYADQLEWLIPYINLGEASSTTGDEDQQFADNDLDREGEEEDGFLPTQVPTATTVSHPQLKRRKQQEPDESTMQFVVTHDSAPREDGLDTFFKSICWTVRKLPPITQAQLRFQITELVFKAEMSHLTNDCDVVNNCE